MTQCIRLHSGKCKYNDMFLLSSLERSPEEVEIKKKNKKRKITKKSDAKRNTSLSQFWQTGHFSKYT